MSDSAIVPMILSGGAGTRLWPLSREAAPKPFMPLPDGETLLGKTAHRALDAAGLDAASSRSPTATTTSTPRTCTAGWARGAARRKYLLEPFGRNTAPAVALAAHYARARTGGRRDAGAGADHLIRDEAGFAVAYARGGARERGQARHVRHHAHVSRDGIRLHRVRRAALGAHVAGRVRAGFVEKPPLAKAREFVAAGTMCGTRACSPSRRARSSRPASATRPPWPRRRAPSGSRWRPGATTHARDRRGDVRKRRPTCRSTTR